MRIGATGLSWVSANPRSRRAIRDHPALHPPSTESRKPQIPRKKLLAIRADIAAGKRRWAKIKTLLSWFGQKGRGRLVVQTIEEALNEAGLITRPKFTAGGVHDYIEFVMPPETGDGEAAECTDEPGTGEGNEADDEDQSESSDGGDGGDRPSSRPAASKFRIGMLEAADRPDEIVTITRDATVEEAATLMIMHRYSQLPVTQDRRRIDGMISWRSMGRARASGQDCKHVRDCLEPVRILDQDAPFFEAVDTITEREVVLVRGKDRKITGIVTTADLSSEYHQKAEPFLLLEEVEDRIRALIESLNLSDTEIKKAGDPGDEEREIEGVDDLTFGEYVRLLESQENWDKLQLGIDRKLFGKLMNDVREVRNDVMHFRPDSSEPEDLDKVRMLRSLLEQLVR